jgi:hypothetical protein
VASLWLNFASPYNPASGVLSCLNKVQHILDMFCSPGRWVSPSFAFGDTVFMYSWGPRYICIYLQDCNSSIDLDRCQSRKLNTQAVAKDLPYYIALPCITYCSGLYRRQRYISPRRLRAIAHSIGQAQSAHSKAVGGLDPHDSRLPKADTKRLFRSGRPAALRPSSCNMCLSFPAVTACFSAVRNRVNSSSFTH